jgi:tetratricopeptide (TPR) repeat protein
LYKHLQEYDEALQLFQRALGVRPGDVDVRYHMGLVYLLQEDQARALELLEGVVREVPGYMEGHVALARIYFRLGRREEAQREREIVERLRAERDAATPKAMTGGDGVPERR